MEETGALHLRHRTNQQTADSSGAKPLTAAKIIAVYAVLLFWEGGFTSFFENRLCYCGFCPFRLFLATVVVPGHLRPPFVEMQSGVFAQYVVSNEETGQLLPHCLVCNIFQYISCPGTDIGCHIQGPVAIYGKSRVL